MKSNLILKKFDTEVVPGTMNVRDLRTFFGGKIAYTEDEININDDAIEFSYVADGKQTGYQYFGKEDVPEDWETEYVENLTDLKDNYHSITLLNQTSANLNTNTRWQLKIEARNILRDYLFFKFKESRLFQSIDYVDVYNAGLNDTLYNYIDWNIIGNYKLDAIELYVKYSDISDQQSLRKNILLKFSPYFLDDVYDDVNKNGSFNIIDLDEFNFETLTINYFQTKPSNVYKFDYYFDLKFVKI
jgi:hypothetical protein